ncbi:MAG: 4Fe-4S dicluster domain-containing protein [Halothiobacillaceae bacterium]
MHTSFLPRQKLEALFDALRAQGYDCVGPRVRDGAIVYEPLEGADDLPAGWRQAQAPGSYRMARVDDDRQFAWANGPQALKPLTFHPRETLWASRRDEQGTLSFSGTPVDARPTAVIGVRACDLAALRLQEAHFGSGIVDEAFSRRRASLLLVAVHCSHPAQTCFCASTGDGPQATQGFDIAMHELEDGFLVESGSERGRQVVEALPLDAGSSQRDEEARRQTRIAVEVQERRLPEGDLPKMLFERLHHPRWDEVADRCLSCGNCTAVCPTCFCNTEQDVPSLDGSGSEHVRIWDSCFTSGHSYLHGIVIRSETKFRYRQWLTHKLGGWVAQYGRSGCTGCGRCISWCPVGIDLTEEVYGICNGSTDGEGRS